MAKCKHGQVLEKDPATFECVTITLARETNSNLFHFDILSPPEKCLSVYVAFYMLSFTLCRGEICNKWLQ